MKTKNTTIISMLLLSALFAFGFSNSGESLEKSKIKPQTIAEPTNIGVEKGKRKYCKTPPNTTTCCGKSYCFVTAKADDGGDVMALNYFEGTISRINGYQLAIDIPYNKILPDVYANWFTNDIFEAEYFPLSDDVASLMDLENIAISEGNYNVAETNTGFRMVINYQTQTGE
jgi:hypothetical protein